MWNLIKFSFSLTILMVTFFSPVCLCPCNIFSYGLSACEKTPTQVRRKNVMQQFTPPTAILQKDILQPNQKAFFEVAPWPLAPHIKDSPHHTLQRVPALRGFWLCLFYVSLKIICNCTFSSQGKAVHLTAQQKKHTAEVALLGLRETDP